MAGPAKPPQPAPGANAPRKPAKAPAKAKPAKRPKGAEGVDVGDSVYVRHPKKGAVAVRVTAHGPKGFIGRCDADKPHKLPWDTYLGHRARMLHRMELVEQGADGALVRDASGRQRFVAGLEMPEPEEESAAANAAAHDDPILGGIDRLTKAEDPMPSSPRREPIILLLKAGGVANRPGLALQQVTDRMGHQTQRWKRNGPEEEKKELRAPMKHGDVVQFRHNDVQGAGKIVASGKTGVTVHDGEREHQVHHDDLIHPEDAKAAEAEGKHPAPAAAAGAGGEGKGPGGGGGEGGAGKAQPDARFDGMDSRPGDDGDQFSAAGHYGQHDAGEKATVEEVLSGFPEDTAEKMAAVMQRAKGVQDTQAMHMKDGAYTEERSQLHETIIRHFLSAEKIEAARPADGEAPTFTLLGGRGGSGKSWFKGQVYDPAKAIVLDADEIKHMLPEYEGWNAFQVHEESGDLFDKITELAQQAGCNIVHDATMKTPAKAVKLVQQFKAAGYRAEAHYMHLPRLEAARRAVKRFLGPTGRFVPPEVILGNTKNEEGFDAVRQIADKWSFRDNQNKDGNGPQLVAEGGSDGGAGDAGRDGGQVGRDGRPAEGKGKPGADAQVSRNDPGGRAGGGGGGEGQGQLRKSIGAGKAPAGAPLILTFARR